jgi:ubiquinone/menaquinone biosynthesis C-methylase UbiE
MSDYYADKLSAERLKRCYEIASPRVRQYLEAEIEFVLAKIRPRDSVLELGCGYGRVLARLAKKSHRVVGIDTSLASLQLAQDELQGISNCDLAAMDAVQLGFRDKIFDVVVCIQNGISAFHVNRKDLIRESVRVAKSGGIVLFSSYSAKFWNARLEWFERQSEAGLLGEIDYEKTRDGVIVCKDGFTATTVSPDEFLSLTADLNAKTRIIEVDESSLFCEIVPH